MQASPDEFRGLVAAVLGRFMTQNDRAAPAAPELAALADRLHALIRERGLPRPLPAGECGTPGGMPEPEAAALALQVAGPGADPLVAEAARQLVKACFHPEFTQCRDSYREVGRDGACRRQQWDRVRTRISGSHCVDCPHWVALTPAAHRDLFTRAWRGDPAALAAHPGAFLPFDFGAFRRWLHAAART